MLRPAQYEKQRLDDRNRRQERTQALQVVKLRLYLSCESQTIGAGPRTWQGHYGTVRPELRSMSWEPTGSAGFMVDDGIATQRATLESQLLNPETS